MIKTKKDFTKLCLSMLEPLKKHYTPQRAGIRIGDTAAWYDEKAAMMEAYSRPLWALGPYFAGGGRDPEFEEAARCGLAAGTDKESGEFWGEPGDWDQRFVEMAAISCSIMLAPEIVWEPLLEQEKDNIAAYLYTINEHEQCGNNWQFFNVLTNLALKSVGRRYSPERMERALEIIDGLYLGDGWYVDGPDMTIDYYNPFALHYYGLLYSVFNREEDPDRAQRFCRRAERFARDFIYWFSDSGEALPIGRSLTYRFAQSAFWSACVFAGIRPFPLGVMKGIIARNLELWASRPVFDKSGLLTIGYAYPNLLMAEHYNAPGSPYWAMKTFFVLALADDHEFWQAECDPLPQLETVHEIPRAEMVIARRKGEAFAYTSGRYDNESLGKIGAKYAKFVYSTKFGFSVPYSCFSIEEAAPDSSTAFEMDGYIYTKRKLKSSRLENGRLVMKWSPLTGIEVTTLVTVTADGHRRETEVVSERECVMYECGPSIENKGLEVTKTDNVIMLSNASGRVQAEGEGGEAGFVYNSANTNLLYPRTAMAYVKYKIEKGRQKFVTEFKEV